MIMIRMQNVTMLYKGAPRAALHDVNVEIERGEFVFLVGPSGCGKSTFIRLLLRELVPSKGDIFIANHDIVNMRRWRVSQLRRNIGCVFQDYKLLPGKTAAENVAFALEVIGKPHRTIKSQVPEVLRLVGLEDKADSFPDELSGGEQQRVSIARAFVNRPAIILADEPTGNLDPATSNDIMVLLNKINRTGTTVLIATHDREMVDNMRKRVLALEEGTLIRDQQRGVYGLSE
jgi:cell division transport system ATP-binding protein